MALPTLVFAFVAALVAFCFVQDRAIVRGVSDYVLLQRAAIAGRGPAVTIAAVMTPAVHRSVRDGLLAAALVAGLGGIVATVAARRGRRD